MDGIGIRYMKYVILAIYLLSMGYICARIMTKIIVIISEEDDSMAKLEGVKVVDMKDGEVTKISYEGEEFERVTDGLPRQGDIAVNDVVGYTEVLQIDSVGNLVVGSGCGLYWYKEDLDCFRKTSANPTHEERITDLEKRVDELEDEEKPALEVGDYAKVVGVTVYNPASGIDEGTFVKITKEQDADGDFRIETPDGTKIDYAPASSLEKVELSDEDLKFVKLGRKPGEFKERDIVGGVNDVGIYSNSEVRDVSRNYLGVIDGNSYVALKKTDAKLIAPVESRVDNDD